MLSTKEAADRLGITEVRVRALLEKNLLEGTKVGRTWVVSEESVEARIRQKPRAGRPPKQKEVEPQDNPFDIEKAHQLYLDCKETLSGIFNGNFLNQAQTKEEEAFFVTVATFFLQEKQKRLIEEGVF
ncbi:MULTISPECIES: helix-turn-helix domain-containing protein [Gordonibacter]|uniref:Helix-turn-helix domain-containing protein n=1 Tax=Gordonibacter faecis TaxID=3047475 RepID=A0ABT7DMX2_9ACTN|nr:MULTISPECIES: helix-turn-helix domain-containing protein [unclassified Gordonibacter]MDJ1650873.1 helix-turn-helix domain-containing protein [Gordonibacter sp. KGMB12511]HIW76129.1 helix-turn-helix domain-containing protein [Candidatus Gordonibacter avicola]